MRIIVYDEDDLSESSIIDITVNRENPEFTLIAPKQLRGGILFKAGLELRVKLDTTIDEEEWVDEDE